MVGCCPAELSRSIVAKDERTTTTSLGALHLASNSTYTNPPGSRILLEQPRADGVLRVCENETHRWLDFGTPFTQSLMCRAEPARLELQYAHGMVLAQAFNLKAQKLLNFGAGCGTFERFFAEHFPNLHIESVEAEPALISIAKEYFALPPRQEIHLGSAENYLDSVNSTADIVLCDLHNGDKNPNCLIDPSFYHDLMRCMNDDAVLVLNLLPTDEQDLIEVLTAVRSAFKWQYILEFDDIGNVLLFAFAHPPPKKDQIKKQAAQLAALSGIDFSATIDRLKLISLAPQTSYGTKW